MLPDKDGHFEVEEESEHESGWEKLFAKFKREMREWPLFLRRSLRSDFCRERATDEERAELAKAKNPVTHVLAQDYAAWRRGMLWVTSVAMCVTLLFTMADTGAVLEDDEQPGVIQAMVFALFCAMFAATVLVGLAALGWANLAKSRRNARLAWILVFFAPFAIYSVPVSVILTDDPGLRIQVGLMMAAAAVLELFPRIIGLFAGVIRSSLTLKTLVSESNTPGWLAVITSPLYGLFLLIALVVVIQLAISIWLVLTLVAFIAAPVLLLMRSQKLMQSLDPKDGQRIVLQIRRTNMICLGAALLFFIIFAGSLNLEELQLSEEDFIKPIFALLASVLLLTVVMSDLMLSLLVHSFTQGQSFQGTEMESTLAGKYDELADVGLGDLSTGETQLLKKLGGAAKAWVSAENVEPTPGPDAPEPPAEDEKKT